jgi:hypothetical protein
MKVGESLSPLSLGSNVKSFKLLIFIILLCCGDAPLFADESRFPLVISGGMHSLTVPWHTGPVTKRLNPALFIGAESTLKSWDRWRLYQTANLGYFQHYWWMTGVLLDTELGISRELPLGLCADLRLGVGYLHYFWRRKTMELKDGEYVQARNWGRPSVMVPLSIVLGYRRISTGSITLAPFVSAQWTVQALLIDESSVMTHLFLLVGTRIDWGKSTLNTGR